MMGAVLYEVSEEGYPVKVITKPGGSVIGRVIDTLCEVEGSILVVMDMVGNIHRYEVSGIIEIKLTPKYVEIVTVGKERAHWSYENSLTSTTRGLGLW